MWYVYMRVVCSGREEFIGIYDTEKSAVCKIAECYRIDWNCGQRGEYYYFLKKH